MSNKNKSVFSTEKRPETRGRSPRSLANLKRPWKRGESGNKSGRPGNAGRTLIEKLNDYGELPEGDIRTIADDDKRPMVDRVAALMWLAAGDPGEMGGRAFDRIMDRTVGKPQAHVDLTSGLEQISLLPITLDGGKDVLG